MSKKTREEWLKEMPNQDNYNPKDGDEGNEEASKTAKVPEPTKSNRDEYIEETDKEYLNVNEEEYDEVIEL